MEKIGEIFISHTHPDAEIALALSDTIWGVFGDQLITSFSTKEELEGGIRPGEDWFRWIVERVRSANIAVILLTPASVQKPWLLWEDGAVYCAGIASENADTRKVRPLLFKLGPAQVPSPFSSIQGVSCDQRSGIERFLNDLIEDFTPYIGKTELLKDGKMLEPTIDDYLERVQKALRNAPLLPTEGAIQEWCQRLDDLSSKNRRSEIRVLHDWLNITFGRGRDEAPLPLDIRLHHRLGEVYSYSRLYHNAVQEFRLAVDLAPRDIFLLRNLGLAYLDDKDKDGASRIIDRIAELDKDAFSRNVECAMLKVRMQRENNNLEGAAETCRRALDHNSGSYYLLDVLGQILLELKRIEDAKSAYDQAREIISHLAEENVWTNATQATASLVLDDEPAAIGYLAKIAALKPEPDKIERIDAGLVRVWKGLNLDGAALDRWRSALRGEL